MGMIWYWKVLIVDYFIGRDFVTDLRHLHNEITSNHLTLLYVEYFSNLLVLNAITTKSMSYDNFSGLVKSVLLCQLSYAGAIVCFRRPVSTKLKAERL